MSNIFVFQSVEQREGFGTSTHIFRDVVVALGEIDTIAVAVSGQGKVFLDGFHVSAVYFDIVKHNHRITSSGSSI